MTCPPRRQGQGSPVPSALTFDHLRHQAGPCALPTHDSKASERLSGGNDSGQSGKNQLLGGGATTTPPKFKKQSLKGHCPSSRHSDNAPQTRASQTRKSKTSQLVPHGAARVWGAETTPSRPGSASPRLGDAGDARRSVVCGARPSSAKSLYSRSGPAAERHRGDRGSG